MIHTVQLAHVTPTAWRNGGGSTRELLAWPSEDAWSCRISVADVVHAGPFSAWPGIERWFAVVTGDGVVLNLPGRRALLTPQGDPLRFDGHEAPYCELLGCATQDLNLMTRHDAGQGAMLRVQPGMPWHSTASLRAVYSAAACRLHSGDETLELPAGTLAWSDDAAGQLWMLDGTSASPQAWWLQGKLP
jgi:uncharacterized protein